MRTQALEEIAEVVLEEKLSGLACEIRFGAPLSERTTFQVGGPADALALPREEGELEKLIARCRSEDLPVTVLGGGANTLVRDGGVQGVVISLSKGFQQIDVLEEGGESALIDAGAGGKIPALVRFAAGRGWEGTECLAGVPGTIGGALAMNAGTAQKYIEDAVESIRWIRLAGGGAEKLQAGAIEFAYRSARLPEPGVVTSVQFRVTWSDPELLRAYLLRDARARRERQPWGLPCAGSIFRNPPGDWAGRLVDAAGLKGRRIGGAEVSEVHGNFIVNRGGATAAEVLSLIEEVRDAVREHSGVDLVLELKVIGEDAP
ncbi:UDP-N-acetylmuramate dehydrogenase [Nitrospinota bacterium]